MFQKLPTLTLTLLLLTAAVMAQRTSPPSKTELAQITERGRQLAQYDVAAWHASNAVIALKPEVGAFARYIAQKQGALGECCANTNGDSEK